MRITAANNPFRVSRTEDLLFFRPDWSGFTWEQLEERWQETGHRAAIIGPHGVGKTTLLESWQKRLEGKGEQVLRIFLNRQERTFTNEVLEKIERATVLLVDGAEQLTWRRRRQLVKFAEGKAWLETRHYQAGFPVIADLQPNRALLDRCLLALGEEVPKELLNDWWESHHGNLREVLLCCYDWKAKRVG